MITRCDILNKDLVTTYSLNTDLAPLTDFVPTVVERVDTSRNKSQQHGTNATQRLRAGLELHYEGNLYGADETSGAYWTERKALLAALQGDPSVAPDFSDKKAGTIFMGFDGETEDYKADFEITLCTIPIAALAPGRTTFAITLFSWLPYMIGVTSGDPYWII